MSFIKPNLISVVKKQYFYKLNTYTEVFTWLIFAQMTGLVFSLSGTSSFTRNPYNFLISIEDYSTDTIILLTFIWACASGISLTLRHSRDEDYFFVTNRLTHHLSNAAFLLTISFIAGITAILSGTALKLGIYISSDQSHVIHQAALPPSELISVMLISVLYISLFTCAGYTIGTLLQRTRLFIALLFGLFLGSAFLEYNFQSRGLASTLFRFYYNEPSPFLFSMKIVLSLTALFSICILISQRMEVKR